MTDHERLIAKLEAEKKGIFYAHDLFQHRYEYFNAGIDAGIAIVKAHGAEREQAVEELIAAAKLAGTTLCYFDALGEAEELSAAIAKYRGAK